ncbi:MAG: TonB family protein [Terracidiphilus sp.]|jgi:TonB family protein
MKWLVLAAIILFAGACPAMAEDHAAEQQMLDSAHKPGDLFQGNANPFDLEVDFTVRSHGPMPGHLSVRWQSKGHWWSKVAVGGFEQTTIRNGEMEYTARNLAFTPEVVQKVFHLLGFDVSSSAYAATGQKSRTVDGIPTTCIETQIDKFATNNREFCFETTSHELLREDWEAGSGEKDIGSFAGYSAFDGTAYPTKFELSKNGEVSISASVAALNDAAFDPSLLVAPKGAIERRKCPGLKPPIPVKRFSPIFNQPGVEGQVTATLTNLADGSVGDVAILHSGGAAMDKAAVDAFKRSTFKPAMCGVEPVVSDIEISVTVRHN